MNLYLGINEIFFLDLTFMHSPPNFLLKIIFFLGFCNNDLFYDEIEDLFLVVDVPINDITFIRKVDSLFILNYILNLKQFIWQVTMVF